MEKMAEEASGAGGDQPPPNYKRLDFKKQSLDDAYAAPANLLEIEVCNSETHGLARNRYTDYEVKMRVSRLGLAGALACVRVLTRAGRWYVVRSF